MFCFYKRSVVIWVHHRFLLDMFIMNGGDMRFKREDLLWTMTVAKLITQLDSIKQTGNCTIWNLKLNMCLEFCILVLLTFSAIGIWITFISNYHTTLVKWNCLSSLSELMDNSPVNSFSVGSVVLGYQSPMNWMSCLLWAIVKIFSVNLVFAGHYWGPCHHVCMKCWAWVYFWLIAHGFLYLVKVAMEMQ